MYEKIKKLQHLEMIVDGIRNAEEDDEASKRLNGIIDDIKDLRRYLMEVV